jgi:hypothetical protein
MEFQYMYNFSYSCYWEPCVCHIQKISGTRNVQGIKVSFKNSAQNYFSEPTFKDK